MRYDHRKPTAADRERLLRERFALTEATLDPRSYRFVNGLGTVYRAEACSAVQASLAIRDQLGGMMPPAARLQVLRNGAWEYVL